MAWIETDYVFSY